MMDILRRALWFSLAALFVWLVHAWHQDYPVIVQKQPIVSQQAAQTPQTSQVKTISLAKPIPLERQITFKTDVVKGVIDKKGGDLVYLELLKHADSLDKQGKPQGPFVLLDHSVNRYYVAQADLVHSKEALNQKELPFYQSDRAAYILTPNDDTLSFELYREENGVKIKKCFTFVKGKYQIDIDYQVNNQSQSLWKGYPYAELKQYIPQPSGWFSSPSEKGVISSDSKPYETIELSKMGRQRLPQNTQKGWLAFVEPYFVSSWISKCPNASYYSYRDKQCHDVYVLGFLGALWEVPAKEVQTHHISLYAGPKITTSLKESAKHLDLVLNYGIFSFLATRFLKVLETINQWVGNWGWSIVCLIILIRLCFYHLSAKGVRATFAMQKLKPQVDRLKARYKEDPYKAMQAEKELYQLKKINSFAPHLPMLLQFPIFLALSALFKESIELRHQPFLWMQDITAPDPYYILPLFYAVLMGIDLRFGVTDSHSQKSELQMIIPLLVLFLFANFSASFVIYIILQSLLPKLEKWWVLGVSLPPLFKSSPKE